MRRLLVTLCASSCLCWFFAAPTAAQLCPPGAGGDCFESNGTPGCDDPACCEAVCAADSFCCNDNWDIFCANQAFELCGGAPTEACCIFDGSCFDLTVPECDEINGTSQGPATTCEGTTCVPEAFEACCLGFDGTCRDLQPSDCENQGGAPQGPATDCLTTTCPVICPGTGDCFDPAGNGSPGCLDPECCNIVCIEDPFCCENTWDDICTGEALAICTGAPCVLCPGDVNFDDERNGLDIQSMVDCLLDPANGPEQPESGGCACADMDGDDDVDQDDVAPFVATLINMGGACPVCGPGNGACFDLNGNGTGGCEDEACCDSVCAVDSFCCETEWDGLCAAQANVICNGVTTEACCLGADLCFDLAATDCVVLGGTAQGIGTDCSTTPCFPLECALGAGDCFDINGNGTPGCEIPQCCADVCAIDAFCCNTEWDGLCAARANAICNGATTESCCNAAAACLDLAPADCLSLGFTPLGPGTTCTNDPCPNPACPGTGSCFTDTNTPGCDDAACCNAVCAVDSFCCDTEWDGLCAAEAQGICAGATTEACCIFGGCADTPPLDCSALGGIPQGPGSSCALDPCP